MAVAEKKARNAVGLATKEDVVAGANELQGAANRLRREASLAGSGSIAELKRKRAEQLDRARRVLEAAA